MSTLKEHEYSLLMGVENPARYVGGEYGSIVKEGKSHLRIALSFPDLYEIGMSNIAIKILYSHLNALPTVAAERVFAVAPDMERSLRERNVPLTTLESRTPLFQCDTIGFSVGYELLATNILQVLDLGGIPRRAEKRDLGDPIVVAGGPGISNPLPLSPLFDAVYIGESEAGFIETMEELGRLKSDGADRPTMVERLRNHRSVWYFGTERRAQRAIWNGFNDERRSEAGFPVSNFRVAQDHGAVEIMRGCPQGCRFCHAGIYYRPYRMKSHDAVEREVAELVDRYGYRDITLSSLSSGDYADITGLTRRLNARFAARGVSFQLPSLRVNSVTLPLLEELSTVKRAGLTFAVETADPVGQRGVNKLVPLERTIEILNEAWERGWRRAKLYFMVGLPIPGEIDENEAIADYIREIRRAVPMEYNINVGTFIPKPHTPFQWSRQLTEDEARTTLQDLKRRMPRKVNLRYYDPFMSTIEGVLARGGRETFELIEDVYLRGARLDAWDEYVRRDAWREALADRPTALASLNGFSPDTPLPWESVATGVVSSVLRREFERSRLGELTERCLGTCGERCGVCNSTNRVHDLSDSDEVPVVSQSTDVAGEERTTSVTNDESEPSEPKPPSIPDKPDILMVRYRREGRAAFLSHLATLRLFERVWYRAALEFPLTSGYSPKPKFSFSQPLPVGMESRDEYVALKVVRNSIHLENDYTKISAALPTGFFVEELWLMNSDRKIPSPMEVFGGAVYHILLLDESISPSRIREALNGRDGVSFESMPDESTPSDQLVIRLVAGTAPGIHKLLRACLGNDVLNHLRATRIRSFATDDTGAGSALVKYRDRYASMIQAGFSASGAWTLPISDRVPPAVSPPFERHGRLP